ncbi:MAG: bifunctional glutamate N-acetyltransferase/amino-acid acetyltransferase ArgJ [Anaerolineae bacterium]|nr:bifunctional glutamate N-acetyltransferase/amino-acid acetyltransferase ArgJ [Anaerolineae bacterium]
MIPLPKGFRASGVAAGIKKNGKDDLAVVASDVDCTAAAVFTTNKVKAAPVLRGQTQMSSSTRLRAVVINAGCANACTGRQGMLNASETARVAAKALHTKPNHVFVMSTGVIGVQLPMDKLRAGVPNAIAALDAGHFEAAANAIMTTDTVPKTVRVERNNWSLTGMAKGAGMIHPNMATMLSVIVTDAAVSARVLRMALKQAAKRSFNRISIDGDTSTNDTLLVLANGASGAHPSADEFAAALEEASISLAKQVARDGEGATKFITIDVTGAKTEKMAEVVGRTIAKSPLVKTAFYGEDANWGRITCAAGYSGEDVIAEKMSLWFGGVHVFAKGMPTKYSEDAATAAMKPHDVHIRLDLGLGQANATVWTCDFSHEYVTVNGKYRT